MGIVLDTRSAVQFKRFLQYSPNGVVVSLQKINGGNLGFNLINVGE
jgi:hypothetical protein